MTLATYLTKRQALVNQALAQHLPPAGGGSPRPIVEAMRYSVLGEGKRIRPILTLAACEAVGGKPREALATACALEMIHAYSLVHDDLPAMDDDDFRRGKPSCHKKFGEAIGVLTGDALLTLSFELLSKENRSRRNPSAHLRVIQEISRAIGTRGMIGGQVADVLAVNGARAHIGAKELQAIKAYGDRVGLTFQLVDDLLDLDGMCRILGVKNLRKQAEKLTGEAIGLLKPFGAKAEPLRALARFILTRKS